MKHRVIKLCIDARGATAIEYGLILGLIGMAMIAGASVVANGSSSIWSNVSEQVSAVEP